MAVENPFVTSHYGDALDHAAENRRRAIAFIGECANAVPETGDGAAQRVRQAREFIMTVVPLWKSKISDRHAVREFFQAVDAQSDRARRKEERDSRSQQENRQGKPDF